MDPKELDKVFNDVGKYVITLNMHTSILWSPCLIICWFKRPNSLMLSYCKTPWFWGELPILQYLLFALLVCKPLSLSNLIPLSFSVWGGVWPVFPKCHAVLQLLCQSDCGPAEENPQQRPVSVYNPALTLLLLASPERRSNALTGTNSHSDFKEYCWHPETFPGNQYPSAELILFSHYIAE